MRTRHGRALTGCLQLLYDAPMLVLWLAALLLAVRGSPLQPNQVYRVADPSIITVLAPGVALKNDNALAMVVAPTLEACAAACRANPQCTEFESCDNDVSGRRVFVSYRWSRWRLPPLPPPFPSAALAGRAVGHPPLLST